MKQEWLKYYRFLEDLRQSGITNMFGAVPYLQQAFPELSELEAEDVLANWMQNYDKIIDCLGKE